ncbi:MAG TPA: hypothetical protein VK066_00820 [Chloroflexota bacterium]|nr:hypothetical protein [Chloroflexota bacterium]
MNAEEARPGAALGVTGRRGGRRTLTLDHVWLVGTLVFAFLTGTLLAAEQPDYWWTVKLGEGLWATHQLPPADPLAFTSTRQPYVEQQWLAQLVLAAVHGWGGLEAALLLRAAILVLTAALLYHAARRAGAGAPAAATACSLAMLSVVGGAAIRPQLLAIPLFALFLLGTTTSAGRGWTLWALPAAMVVWANAHGSFPLGIALVGIALLARALEELAPLDGLVGVWRRVWREPLTRRLALLLGLCLLAPLVNPYGAGIIPWLVDYLTFNLGGTGLATLSQEWLPTSLGTVHGTLFFLGAFVLAVVLLRAGPPRLADLLRLLVFGVLALQAVRSTLWWAMVAAPVLAWGITVAVRGPGRVDKAASAGGTIGDASADRVGVPALNAVIVAGFLAVAALSLPWLRPLGLLFAPDRWPIQGPDLPVAAADRLATLPTTRLYNAMDWGGYLAWRLAPRQRIFVDARFQLYPPVVYQDYFAIANAAPGWAECLAAHAVDGIVISRADQPALLRALVGAGGWQAVYCDDVAAVYVRRELAGPDSREGC